MLYLNYKISKIMRAQLQSGVSMKTIVVYSSKTGFVRKYAKWIAEELSTKAVPTKDIEIKELQIYDTIIFGGGLYAGGINGIKLVKRSLENFDDKNIVMFITGASPGRKHEIDEVWDKNFTKEEQDRMGLFYLRGGFNYDKLGVKDKMLMTLLRKKLQSKKELTEDEEGMLAAYEEPADFTDKENIKDLIEFVRRNPKQQ